MKDLAQVAHELLERAQSDGENVDPLVVDLLDNLTSRIQALEGDRAQVDYHALTRAQRDEAIAKRDLAQLLLSTARSVACLFRPTVRQ
jgi:hypothetical protein